jgi:polo-like kinase 2
MANQLPYYQTKGPIETDYDEDVSEDDEWNLIGPLGSGGFADCYKVYSTKNKRHYVFKCINTKKYPDEAQLRETIRTEIDMHKSLMHNNIVRYRCCFPKNDLICIVLEYCNGRTLQARVKHQKRFCSEEAQHYMRQLVRAVGYLHNQNILHRDIKPSNVFLHVPNIDVDNKAAMEKVTWRDVVCKLGDFGLATSAPSGELKSKSICGTITYIAPEIIKDKTYSTKSDIWALGCCLYTMLVGRSPFCEKSNKAVKRLIRKNDYNIPDELFLDFDAVSLIRKMLNHDPNKRPTILEVAKHPFITKLFVSQ